MIEEDGPRIPAWRVLRWDQGTTEPGSSGSGLWNQDHLIVGTLSGGSSQLLRLRRQRPAGFLCARLDTQWQARTTVDGQLKVWLGSGCGWVCAARVSRAKRQACRLLLALRQARRQVRLRPRLRLRRRSRGAAPTPDTQFNPRPSPSAVPTATPTPPSGSVPTVNLTLSPSTVRTGAFSSLQWSVAMRPSARHPVMRGAAARAPASGGVARIGPFSGAVPSAPTN